MPSHASFATEVMEQIKEAIDELRELGFYCWYPSRIILIDSEKNEYKYPFLVEGKDA